MFMPRTQLLTLASGITCRLMMGQQVDQRGQDDDLIHYTYLVNITYVRTLQYIHTCLRPPSAMRQL